MRRVLLVMLIGCGDDQTAGPRDAALDAALDAPSDAKLGDGTACTSDSECASSHCVANVPAGTGSTCCATACDATDGCHVAQCSTGTCQDTSIASGGCAISATGQHLTTCGAEALGCAAPADTDGDNLPDAWESSNNGVGVPFLDLDCNATWNPATEPLLVGASPTTPDVYVTYDYMGYGLDDESCASDSACTGLGAYHAGETCDGEAQCRFICSQDADCTATSRGPAHAAERCRTIAAAASCPDAPGSPSGTCACFHTHDPEAIAPGALSKVVDAFALHGVALHIVRGREHPHSHVVSYRADAHMTIGCEGASVAAGTVGAGKYAVSLYDLKALASGARNFMHYALFAHHSGCDSGAHCPANLGSSSNCADSTLTFGQTGIAELDGGDLIVSLGSAVNNSGLAPGITSSAGFSRVGAAFMHELGHNFGIRHDGHVDRPCPSGSGCAVGETCTDVGNGEGMVCHAPDEPNYKPNYVSIMNYLYADGIQSSSTQNVAASGMPYTPGSNVPDPALTRLDYSNQVLPTLHEDNLDDVAGLGWPGDSLYPGAYLLFEYVDAVCHVCPQIAPAAGSVDWVCTNCITNNRCQMIGSGPSVFDATGVTADVDAAGGACDASPSSTLTGHKDWGNFVYGFQCAPNFDD